MKLSRVIGLALVAASGISITAERVAAQGALPAEFPPASFEGRQYVDSSGCVFIRAGIDGNVTWVPRVDRNRRLICGQRPTFANAPAATREAPPRAALNVPEQITLDRPATDVEEEVPVRVAQARTTLNRRAQPAPPVVTDAAVRPPNVDVAVPAPRARQSDAVAVNANAEANEVVPRPRPERVTRQARATAEPTPRPLPTAAPQRRAATAQAAPRRTVEERVVPGHLAARRANVHAIPTPPGFQPAWTDDRLNPRRAEGTREGYRQMDLIWTRTVPRRLINRATGEDVTARQALVFPFTDQATQEREFGKVTLMKRDGKIVKRIQRNKTAAKVATNEEPATKRAAVKAAVKPAPTKAKANVAAAAQGRFVQVAMFGVPENATRAVAQLKAAGLPARSQKITRKGKAYELVFAGPFGDGKTTARALKLARTQGFSDAFVRK